MLTDILRCFGFFAVQQRRLLDRLAQMLRQRRRLLLARVGEEDDELLAAHAEERVELADPLLDDGHHALQNVVAHCVAVLVVDPLEVIDVDQQERRRRLRATEALDGVGEPRFHVTAVVGAGERIDDRLPHELLLQLADDADEQVADHGRRGDGREEADRHRVTGDVPGGRRARPPTSTSVSAIAMRRESRKWKRSTAG